MYGNFIYKRRDLQFKVESEDRIEYEFTLIPRFTLHLVPKIGNKLEGTKNFDDVNLNNIIRGNVIKGLLCIVFVI